jgi:hypothetical protein
MELKHANKFDFGAWKTLALPHGIPYCYGIIIV